MSLGTRAIKGTSATSVDRLSRYSSNSDAVSVTRSESFHSDFSSKSSLPSVRESMAEDGMDGLSLRAVAPVGVTVRDLSLELDSAPSGIQRLGAVFKSKKQKTLGEPHSKAILKDVSAQIPAGSLTAILGASGSGKTSLLNTLSQRMTGGRLKRNGEILYNGDSKLSSIRSAYVMQKDVLLPTLTVRETLEYSAELRLPPPVTAEEREAVVEEILLELGLKECADTRIGNNERKGCSGGEKRRTSLGVQLLANPSVLFLDEVTTGLDATSALQLIQTLKDLSRKGRTIIVTLHQPRSEIWGLFDHLILLTGGSPVYSGPTDSCLSYFEKLGYTLPSFVNPAEYLIDLAAIDTRSQELEEQSLTRVQRLVESWKMSTMSSREKNISSPEVHSTVASITGRSSFSRQLRVQTARTIKTTLRDPLGMTGSLIEAIFMGVITGWVFLNQDESLTGIRSREGSLYTAAAFQGFLILVFETYRLTLDVPIFDREHAEGVVGVSSFLLSRRLARLFIEDIPVPLIFSACFYFLAGFRHLASQFFMFYALLLLSQYLSVTFAMFCVALSRNFAGASLIANLNFTVQTLCSGYFVQSNQIPIYVRWLKYGAYVWYVNGALCANEFLSHTSSPTGQFYACPAPGGPSNPECQPYTGVFIMNALGFQTDWTWKRFVIIAALIVSFYSGAGFVFKFKKIDIEVARARSAQVPIFGKTEQRVSAATEKGRTIDVTLEKCSLEVKKRISFGTRTITKSILKPVTTTFEAGVLNVIMGPSGSGKTSLLNLMAYRHYNSASTRYLTGGKMLYGGAVPSDDAVRSVSSYVCQDDDALLPTLTVRETLHFAAGLRLPTWMSTQEKIQRADSVLLKLGLRGCADNLVGNDLIKGISGGEKRRVSIAVQILTEPRILLLDEPTSGLDAFTATSIIECLKGLAEEGRTLVLTIHQPSSNLFRSFGNILLLARGGFPVYAGKGNAMLSHFSNLGFTCPETMNPADFALDLITVNLQKAEKEAITRDKVQFLVSDWEKMGTASYVTSQISTPAELGSLKRAMTPFRVSFPLLIRRSFINFKRDPNAIIARTTQVLGFGIFMALFFAPLKSDYESIQSRFGFIQEFVAIYFVGMLQNVAVYPSEKSVFYREYQDGAYSIEAFFLEYTAMEIPFEIFTSLIFSLLGDLAVGLPRTATMFFVLSFNCFCIVNCGESLGIMFNTLFNHSDFAVNLTSAIISISTLMAGTVSLNVPAFLQAFNHLSPLKWAIANLAPYSMQGLTFTCDESQRVGGLCPIETGAQALKLYKLSTSPGLNLMALGICTIGYRLVSYLLLRAIKTHWSWKKS